MESSSIVEFHEDAIVLSGATGTKLKCDIIGRYYPLWWNITSGGPNRKYRNPASFVEINAGSGEDYIDDTQETILGSSGHALKLKLENPDTSKLKVVLVEEDDDCYRHLKNVIRRRWPNLNLDEAEGPLDINKTRVHLIHKGLNSALEEIEKIVLGNSLFFFDPLLYTPWSEIERVAKKRITWYYKTRTEFIVFLFSSDWFMGRGNLNPLPSVDNHEKWKHSEMETVRKMNDLFGSEAWRPKLLNSQSYEDKLGMLVGLYRDRLRKWFRYVLPLPFEPKSGQTYHLFMCSNYEAGVEITRRFYTLYTNNPKYSPDNQAAYSKFKALHPEIVMSVQGIQRPDEWKFLWAIIKHHDRGVCDIKCEDLKEKQPDWRLRVKVFQWLESMGYLSPSKQRTDAWDELPPLYRLNWDTVKEKLGVDPPPPLKPLSSHAE